MDQIFPLIKKFLSKFWLEVIPAVAASVIGGYLLTQFHLRGDQTPQKASLTVSQPAAKATAVAKPDAAKPDAAKSDMTSDEDRKVTREILRTRRDTQEAPAEVTKRVPSITPEDLEAAIKAAITPPDQAKADQAKPGPRVVADPVVPNPPVRDTRSEPPRAAPVDLARRPDTEQPAQIAGQPVLSGAANGQLYVPPAASQTLPTVDVSAREAPRTVGDAPQGPVGSALSTASIATGKAVNAVGDTVGWVIGLPGKIIGR